MQLAQPSAKTYLQKSAARFFQAIQAVEQTNWHDVGTSITYTFEEKADGTHFRRVMEPGSVRGSMPLPATDEADWLSMANLKALVENIIWCEQKGPYLK